jgi:hypothetical protein
MVYQTAARFLFRVSHKQQASMRSHYSLNQPIKRLPGKQWDDSIKKEDVCGKKGNSSSLKDHTIPFTG